MHNMWVSTGQQRSFDVFLCYFGNMKECPYTDHVDYVVKRKGTKFPNLAQCYTENAELFNSYDAIWIVDDDMMIGPRQIDRLFDIHMREQMSLSQPSFDRRSFTNHDMLYQNTERSEPVRLTNFVENSLAVFSKEAFQICLHTFFHPRAVSGWGMDAVWSKLLGNPICDKPGSATRHRIGVIDTVSCYHPHRTDENPSELDVIVPRDAHELDGLELVHSYGLNCDEGLNLVSQ